ncbi:MAG: amino acid adenylation domain-containing protein, partial [Gemmatimonadetes bacterium]|nr:amino acid adenylation domain-containing protein [Gemmatimonadota bacterium]
MNQVIEGYRLSPVQRRLWPLHGAAGAWATLRVRGRPDPEGVRLALHRVAERSEILRTRFVREPRTGLPLQVIGDAEVAWEPDEDWRGRPPGAVEDALAERMQSALCSPFDLEHGAPLRARMVQTGAAELLLLVHAPAMMADAATLRLLPAELARAYAGQDAPDEALQFADVSEWQLEAAESTDAAEGRRFWQSRPAAGGPLRLPGETGGGTWNPRVLRARTAAGVLPGLRAAAADMGVPLPDLLLAAFHVLVHRLTLRAEVQVAAAFDGRGFEEMADALGPFGHFLPVGVRLSAGTPVRDVAREVSRAVAEARPWQDFYPAGQTGGEPVPASPVAFAWSGEGDECAAGGLRFGVLEAWVHAERFRLALACRAEADGVALRVIFDAAALPCGRARAVAESYEALLRDLAARPDATVGGMDVIAPRERVRLLGALAAGPEVPADAGTVVDWILARAAHAPKRTALVSGHRSMDYAELARQVEGRAARLRAAGAGPEVRVAVVGERSAEAVVSLLAVMRAGAAYVPLDAAYPPDRLRFVLRDAGVALVVAAGAGADELEAEGWTVLRPLAEEPAPAGPPGVPIDPCALAYVIYTSGTTGRPKGIGVEHAALAQYAAGVSRALELPEGAAYALVSTFAADLGHTMVFPALAGGGTLHVASDALATDPEGWAEYAARHGVDAMKLVPSHLRLLLEAESPERVLPRACLVLGGEASDWELVDRVRALAPGCRVFNHYGPTEATVGVAAGEMDGAGDGRPAAPPLGRPLPGVRLHLLDSALRLAPDGVPGELCVGGGSVARGYPGHPGLTADRFVPDPFAPGPGARMYRTGDRARWLADGRLEFLGRTDDQVKVSGHRVEPAEVAAVLAAHPRVAECRVVAGEHAGQVRLVAYLVPAGDGEPAAAELRAWLADRLPEPMVPSAFVPLRRFPLTPNGKLDVAALPSAAEGGGRTGPGRAPRDAREARLVRLYADVLGTEHVGVEDDFFALGGNSFLAVRLMSRIQKEFGCRLPLAALVGAGTVERIAPLVGGEAAGARDGMEHLVPLTGGGRGTPLFCVHPGEGTVLCYRALAGHLDPPFPVYGIQALDFEADREALGRIEEMAARYVDAVVRAHPGPVRLAGWSFGGLVAFEMARQLRARGVLVERLVLFDCRLPVTAPALARVDPVFHRLSMLFHPRLLVAEDGSMRVPREALDGLALAEQLELVSARVGVPVEA